MSEAVFVPKKTGANFDLPPEIAPLKSVQQHINLFTNYKVFKDANEEDEWNGVFQPVYSS